jgi:predicted GNAT superfamily acetyltransferase
LRKLGCVAKEYEINIYGETSSHLHSGSPTDRLIAHWQIPRLSKVENWDSLPQEPQLVTRTIRGEDGFLRIQDADLNRKDPLLFMEIPENMQQLKVKSPEEALNWRFKTREIFTTYFDKGYIAYSFLHWKQSAPARSFYVLKSK